MAGSEFGEDLVWFRVALAEEGIYRIAVSLSEEGLSLSEEVT